MNLRAGASAAVITPPVGYPILPSGTKSTDIDDDLMTRCLVLSDNHSTVAIVALDIIRVDDTLHRIVAARTSAATGIPASDVFVVSTGNATSPMLSVSDSTYGPVERYSEYLPDIVAGNAVRALSTLEPAAIASTTVQIPNICSFERTDGGVQDDERLTRSHLMAIQNSEERIVAAVVSCPCPAVVRTPTDRWTADFPGALCWMLQQSGIETPIFVQGNSEGIVPFDWYYGNPNPSHPNHSAEDANALALIVATQVAQKIPTMVPRRNVEPREFVETFLSGLLSAR